MEVAKFRHKISVEDYLEAERTSPAKHEFVNGEVFAMAGASGNHNRIVNNLTATLLAHLNGSTCEPFSSDIKVQVTPSVFYYPDVLVTCEESAVDSDFRNEPILIVEVISRSTENIDRREKMFLYQQIPSLQEYLLIDQYNTHAEVRRRHSNGAWTTYFFTQPGDIIELTSVGLNIPLPELYRRVQFEKHADRDRDEH